mgnify:CR=1 FL=1
MKNTKKDIRVLTRKEIQDFFLSHNIPSFKGNQVYQWLWKKGVHDFDLMTNLSLEHRILLKTHFEINHINIDFQQRSADGTIKIFNPTIFDDYLTPLTDVKGKAWSGNPIGVNETSTGYELILETVGKKGTSYSEISVS